MDLLAGRLSPSPQSDTAYQTPRSRTRWGRCRGSWRSLPSRLLRCEVGWVQTPAGIDWVPAVAPGRCRWPSWSGAGCSGWCAGWCAQSRVSRVKSEMSVDDCKHLRSIFYLENLPVYWNLQIILDLALAIPLAVFTNYQQLLWNIISMLSFVTYHCFL